MHAAFYDAGLEDDLVNRVVAAIMKRTELTFNRKETNQYRYTLHTSLVLKFTIL